VSNLQRVQRAAVELFAERGYTATGIRDIARHVGLTSAALYHYTGGKELLLVGVMRDSLIEMQHRGRQAVAFSADPVVRLARLVKMHVGVQAFNPCSARVTDSEVRSLTAANRGVVVGLRNEYESLWQRVLDDGVRSGEFTIADTRIARLALLETCNGVVNWYKPGGRLSLTEIQDHFVLLACRLAGARLVNRAECGDDVIVPRFSFEPETTPDFLMTA
jgi:TetR/AcrR family transcriptional regulator, cholesterol catabolism regulator